MLSLALAALLLASPEGRYADVDDVRLYYEVTGHGPPVLALHGGGGSSKSLAPVIAALSARYTVIAPDARAHGRSTDSAKPLTYSRLTEDMVELLDKLKVGPVIVVGWSDGGIVGLELAVHHPERVTKLVAFGANARLEGLTDAARAWVQTATAVTLAKSRETYEQLAPDPKHWPVFAEKLTALWRTQVPISEAELARIKAPTLIAVGDRDMVRLEHAVELYRTIPGAQLFVAPGSTHYVLRERPAHANQVVLDFLAGSADAGTP